ncbi:MAG: PadR family transcriptional regulator [Myxococcota bacterium]
MSLRHTLLGILDWVPSHGYALREMAKGYSWLYPMTNANIYPTLRQLESEGFVEHRDEVHDGRLRKIYNVTSDGRGELRRWLADPNQQQGTWRDPALLKICMLREGAADAARPWIEEHLEAARTSLDEAERYMKDEGQRLPTYTRLVAEHGRELLRLRVHWLSRVVDEIDDAARESHAS